MSLADSLSQAGNMNELDPWSGRISKLCGVEALCAIEQLVAEWETCEVSTASATRCLFMCECITMRGCVFFMVLTWLL